MRGYGKCPRCGVWGLEHLETHSHCWECNFFPEEKSAFRLWSLLEFRLPLISWQRRSSEQKMYRGLPQYGDYEIPYERERLITNPIRGIL